MVEGVGACERPHPELAMDRDYSFNRIRIVDRDRQSHVLSDGHLEMQHTQASYNIFLIVVISNDRGATEMRELVMQPVLTFPLTI